MVPQTVVAFVAFLLLVAPGLFFELLRERRRPTIKESAFREASRTGFASLVFTSLALLMLALVRAIRPDLMPDPGRWLQEKGRYLETHYRLITGFFALEVLLALALALLADGLFRRHASGQIVPGDIWYQVFRTDRPKDKHPWVSLRLTDKTHINGYLRHYTVGEEPKDREIALQHSRKRTNMRLIKDDGTKVIFDEWQTVVVRADQIAFIKVTYLPSAEPAKQSWWQRNAPPPSAVSPGPVTPKPESSATEGG